MFINHKVEDNTIILYLDPNLTEFSKPLGFQQTQEKTSLTDAVKAYIKDKLPHVKNKTAKVMLGTLLVASIPLMSDENKVAASEVNSYYTVQPGDSLWKIATNHNINVDELKQMNNLSGNNIYVGQVLDVASETNQPEDSPTYTVKSGDSLYTIANQFQMSIDELKKINHLSSDMIYVGQTLQVHADEPSSLRYTVKAGDTLNSIAMQFNVTIDQLKANNYLTTNMIYAGQTLQIPESPQTTKSIYIVKSGDTLSRIATQVNLTTDQLKTINNLSSDMIYVGQSLKVEQDSINQTDQGSTYIVKSGDTLSAIAKQNNISVEQIKKINNLSSNMIYVGQTLKLVSEPESEPSPDQTTNILKEGIESAEVTELQNNLSQLGFFPDSTTGYYGSSTTQAVFSFQSAYGILTTGEVDQVTNEEIERALTKQQLVNKSSDYTGVPYVWGGKTPNGFDCSGFVFYMFQSVGVDQPYKTSSQLYLTGDSISRENLQPGDLVFFGISDPGQVTHVGFYTGNNEFISATSSKGIWKYSLDNPYWSQYYMGAKRVY